MFKKMMIISALTVLTGLIWAQCLETFANFTATGSAYTTGSFPGQDGSLWQYTEARGDIALIGKALTLGRGRTPQAQLVSGSISGGIGSISFDYMQAFSTDVNLNILVNDLVVGTVTSSGQENQPLSSGEIIVNISGDFVLTFISVENSDGQVTIDNIAWTAFASGDTAPPPPLALEASDVSADGFVANWLPSDTASSYRLDVYRVTSQTGFDDLIFSEYIEGSSYNKAIEIYNGTGSTMSLDNYSVRVHNNGSVNPSYTLNLGGSLPSGEVYVMAHASAADAILDQADYTNAYALGFNGNDAIVLYDDTQDAYVDIFGVIGSDPGTAWTADGGYSTKDKTLLRKPEIRGGVTTNPASDFETLATEWDLYSIDTYDYLGWHSPLRRDVSYVPGYNDLNLGDVTSHPVSGLQPDTDYYYVIRAVNSHGISEDSNEIGVFTQVINRPTIQARQIEAAVSTNSISLEWTPGNGSRRLVVMNTTNYFNTPSDGSDPPANPEYSGSGQQVIYNSATQIIEDSAYNGVLVEGLEPGTTYHFRVFEYNGFGPGTIYLSSTATGNPTSFTTLSGGFTGYYEDIQGYGAELKTDLHELLRTTHNTEYSYDALWSQLRYTDEDPLNSNNIIQIYTGWSIPKSSNGGGTTQWNREHTWSKSHGNFGDNRPAGTDLHHMRPCDATVNSAKGNKDFDEGGSLYVDGSPYPGYSGNTGNYTSSTSWEPRDEDKGDVARMIMYMAIRYEGTDTDYDLELVDYTASAPNYEPYYGKLSTLLDWHRQDPPDDWEDRRNGRIAERQGNRNPFIDHPEFAWRLWTPHPLPATNLSQSAFTAHWAQPITGQGYHLQVATDSLFTSYVNGYADYYAGQSLMKAVSGLQAGTTYYYRLRTDFGSNYSPYSPFERVSTDSAEPIPTTMLLEISEGIVHLYITPIDGIDSYQILASDDPEGEFFPADGSFVSDTLWTCPLGDEPRRFFKVYGIPE